jgi:predicted transcriptional regulator
MKIHELSEQTRKLILWGVVIVVGVILVFWWGKSSLAELGTLSAPKVPKEIEETFEATQEQFSFPNFKEIEIPPELLQEIEQLQKEDGQTTGQ